MRRLTVGTVVTLALLLWTSAAAQVRVIGEITEADRTALSVLLKAGCDPDWLSQVRVEERFSSGVLRKEVKLDAFSCYARPPEWVVKKSAELLKKPARKTVPKPPSRARVEIPQVKPSPAPPPPLVIPKPPVITPEAETVQVVEVPVEVPTVNKDKETIGELERALVLARSENLKRVTRRAFVYASFGTFLLGFVIAVVLMRQLNIRHHRQKQKPRVTSVADERLRNQR